MSAIESSVVHNSSFGLKLLSAGSIANTSKNVDTEASVPVGSYTVVVGLLTVIPVAAGV